MSTKTGFSLNRKYCNHKTSNLLCSISKKYHDRDGDECVPGSCINKSKELCKILKDKGFKARIIYGRFGNKIKEYHAWVEVWASIHEKYIIDVTLGQFNEHYFLNVGMDGVPEMVVIPKDSMFGKFYEKGQD